MGRLSRIVRALALVCMACLFASCSWVLNEFFVYDVPPVPMEDPSGAEPKW